MKRTPQQKLPLLFEAMKRSLLMSDLLLTRLEAEVQAIERLIDKSVDPGSNAIPPLLSAMSFIDFAHRFGEIADALPLINKKGAEYRHLRDAMKSVESVRHHLQHMRGDLSSNAEIDYPILGSFSWTNGAACYTVFLSQPSKAEAFTIVYDTVRQKWTARYQFTAKKMTVNLDDVMTEMKNLYQWVASQLTFDPPDLGEYTWGRIQSFAVQIGPGRAQQSLQADGTAPDGPAA